MADIIPLPITPPPGVIKTETPHTSEGRWTDTEKIRFRGGKPEKIGGWTKKTPTPMAGTPRTLLAWRDNNATEYMGAGTYKKLYVIDRGFALHNITPTSSTGSLTNPFTTTLGSTTVTVAHTAHARQNGDAVKFSGAAPVGGVDVNGEYTVANITVNTYEITIASAALSSATGGGTVSYEYEVPIGSERGAFGLGYGIGGWGLGGYGTPRDTSTLFIEPRIWALDHFGKILLAAYNESAIYSWDPNASPAYPRASLIADAPTDVRSLFVTPERFVVALCAQMNIKWCSQSDYATWTPTLSNTAGIRGVTEGTKLIGGRPLGGGISLILSDSALYLHQYTGSSLVFDTRLAGRNCGLISPSALITAESIAYWMGPDNFFMFDGSVKPIPNVLDIHDYIFDQLRTDRGYLCAAFYVPRFKEVWFFVVVQGSEEPGLYAIYNVAEPCWSVGTLTRVAGTYFGHGDTRPYWAADDGYLYFHEDGRDADGAAMAASLTLAPYGLGQGKQSYEVLHVAPDFHEQSGDVTLSLSTWNRIRSTATTPLETQSKPITATDGLVDYRVSGRYVGMTVLSNTLGGHFRFGVPVAYGKPAGDRL